MSPVTYQITIQYLVCRFFKHGSDTRTAIEGVVYHVIAFKMCPMQRILLKQYSS